MNKEDVTHRGVVESAGIDSLTIRTEEACKCDGCALTALCTTKDEGHELLTIDTPLASDFAAGDRVEVTATSGSTLRATWWALVLPTLIFGGSVVGFRLGFPQLGGWALAIGFGLLAVYDLFLYRYRRQLAQKISWKIRRL